VTIEFDIFGAEEVERGREWGLKWIRAALRISELGTDQHRLFKSGTIRGVQLCKKKLVRSCEHRRKRIRAEFD
jgi:hypothetical protein